MIKSPSIRMCALHLVLVCFARSVLTSLLFKDDQLYAGDRCRLEIGGGEGVCTKAVNCLETKWQIKLGSYRNSDRCSFLYFDEMVCCATFVPQTKNRKRPADAACDDYKKITPRARRYKNMHIIDGVGTAESNYPSMAALGYAASNEEEGAIRGRKYVCGGTLISQKHVVTAAHCVNNIQGLVPVEVLLGTIDLTKPNAATMQRIPISRIIEHPRHRRSLYYHDVAILELEYSIRFSADVRPTCLMTRSPETLAGRADLHVLGWGAVDLGGSTSTKLLAAKELQVVEATECSERYKNLRAQIPRGLNDGMLCAVDSNSVRRADTCWGDSGGPLLLSTSREKFPPLVGVTSFGNACGGTTPGVYTSIYKYLSWIEDQVWPDKIEDTIK